MRYVYVREMCGDRVMHKVSRCDPPFFFFVYSDACFFFFFFFFFMIWVWVRVLISHTFFFFLAQLVCNYKNKRISGRCAEIRLLFLSDILAPDRKF
ncbi:hypothetical protein CROQUDRAFT_213977 [Cronartium quercuum f. sp. fusiforme G11]|uniref:Uncharacterized protein n=1 Tax=Cronartium quercuum f. sp. fusiforme G11 TaxID=708437 RepID=A0A9P6TFV0_9BASI|nr:hypothetical protein CROQUDRAFT_213977 [Cronartium quercuum f. sp. fusiforme G11]